jgi:hypothetical protein
MSLSNIGLKKAFDQIGSELTAEEGLTMQTRPHAFTRESDHTSIKQNWQTSMSEIRRVFDRNLARDESVAAPADQQSKRQELGRTGHDSENLEASHRDLTPLETSLPFIVLGCVIVILIGLLYVVFRILIAVQRVLDSVQSFLESFIR